MSLNFYDQLKELFRQWRELLPGGVHFLTVGEGRVTLEHKSDTGHAVIVFDEKAIQFGDAAEFGRVAATAMAAQHRAAERSMKLTAMAAEMQHKVEHDVVQNGYAAAPTARSVDLISDQDIRFRFVAKQTEYGAEVYDYKLPPRPVLMAQFPGGKEEALKRARAYAAFLSSKPQE